MRAYQNSLADPDNCDKYRKYTIDTVPRGNENAVTCVCMKKGLVAAFNDAAVKSL